MFILRKLSTDGGDKIRRFQTIEVAQARMRKEYDKVEREYEDADISENDATCTDNEAGKYAAWLIYKEPASDDIVSQALVALAMAELGLSKYQIELESAEDCGRYLSEARALLGSIRENGTDLC